MRYLVAPKEKDTSEGGFTFTNPGEPLVLPTFVCSSSCDCGCNRSFVGINSRKGTTIGEVQEVNETIEELARLNLTNFCRGLACASFSKEVLDKEMMVLQSIAATASLRPIGTRMTIRSDNHVSVFAVEGQ